VRLPGVTGVGGTVAIASEELVVAPAKEDPALDEISPLGNATPVPVVGRLGKARVVPDRLPCIE
jgi:hypothetical protein